MNDRNKTTKMNYNKRIIFFVLGGSLLFWSFICFIGEANEKFGSSESIRSGVIYLIIGGVFVVAGGAIPKIKYTKKWKMKKKKWIEKHKGSNGKKYWAIHYMYDNLEYVSGEYSSEKEAEEALENYNI